MLLREADHRESHLGHGWQTGAKRKLVLEYLAKPAVEFPLGKGNAMVQEHQRAGLLIAAGVTLRRISGSQARDKSGPAHEGGLLAPCRLQPTLGVT